MENNIQIFEGKKIRSVWDNEKEEWYFSVVDVVGALTDSVNARDYWYKMKKRMTNEEKSELSTICRQLKLKAPDGKMRLTDVADIQGIFRIIQSIPSPKAEPFKTWLAQAEKDRIDEITDPELTIDRALETYLKKGYSKEWINQRLQAIQVRKELKESHSLSLLNYLYAVNCVIYNEEIKMQEDIRKEIKDEIRKWSIFSSVGKFNLLGDYMFLFNSSDYWNDEEKNDSI